MMWLKKYGVVYNATVFTASGPQMYTYVWDILCAVYTPLEVFLLYPRKKYDVVYNASTFAVLGHKCMYACIHMKGHVYVLCVYTWFKLQHDSMLLGS